MENCLHLPANCIALTEEEMIAIGGGAIDIEIIGLEDIGKYILKTVDRMLQSTVGSVLGTFQNVAVGLIKDLGETASVVLKEVVTVVALRLLLDGLNAVT